MTDPTQNQQENLDHLEQTRAQGGVGMATVDETADAFGRGEGVGEAQEVAGLSQGRIVLGRFFRHAGALFGLVTLALVALLSCTAMGVGPISGWWRQQNPNASANVLNGGAPTLHMPRWLGGSGFQLGQYPFGQNEIGQDNFAQVMAGIQTSLVVMLVMGLVVMLMGVTIGSLSGYYRGWLDSLLMRFTDLVITLPVIVIGSVLGILIVNLPQKWGWSDQTQANIQKAMPVLLAIALGMILWPGLARLVRSEFLSLREREFVDSARVAGASNFRIITKHILPNCVGVIIVNVTLMMSASVVLETALSYLQFGIKYPSVSLGLLISSNEASFDTRPWLFWWPGVFIILMALSVNFIGDGLRDAFDPRTKRIPSEGAMDRAEARAAIVGKNSTTIAEAGGAGH